MTIFELAFSMTKCIQKVREVVRLLMLKNKGPH